MKRLGLLLVLAILLISSPAFASFGEDVVNSAKSLSYIRENTNRNDHPMIDKMLKFLGLPTRLSWCLAFGQWVYHVAAEKNGVKHPIMKTARCFTFWTNTQGDWRYRHVTAEEWQWGAKVPQGAIGIFSQNHIKNKNNWDGHAAIFEAAAPKRRWWSWEGNTMPGPGGNQREGGGVYHRLRGVGSESFLLMGFVIPTRVKL